MDSHLAKFIAWLSFGLAIMAAPAMAAETVRILTVEAVHYDAVGSVYHRVTRTDEGWRKHLWRSAYDFTCEKREYTSNPCEPYLCGEEERSFDCLPHPCRPDEVRLPSYDGLCHERCFKKVPVTCYRRRCPVMEDYCRYKYDVWELVRQEQLSGDDLNVVVPLADTQTSADVRFESALTFKVTLRGRDGKTYEYVPKDLQDFSRFAPGSKMRAEFDIIDRLTVIRPVKAK